MKIGGSVYCVLKSETGRLVIFDLVVISFNDSIVCCAKGKFDEEGALSQIVFIERNKIFNGLDDAALYILNLEDKVKEILSDEKIVQENLFSRKVDAEVS